MAKKKKSYERVDYEQLTNRALLAAAQLFLKQGYAATSVRQIAEIAGVGISAMMRTFKTKEKMLCELVNYVLDGQFEAAKQFLNGVEHDPMLYYAAETTLQLYMAESDEAIRDLYGAAYSLPESAELIRQRVSKTILPEAFGENFPEATTEDFYHLEIASGSVIWGYLSTPCTPEFPMEEKVERFLDASLRIYHVSPERIAEAQKFVEQFDYPNLAQQTVQKLVGRLGK